MNLARNDEPLVSVVVCVYNAGEYLRPAVESVVAQTYRNLEILLVDDGSTDGCMDSIRDIQDSRIRIIHQENRGKPAAMNVALAQMRGKFYAIQDADDLSHADRIRQQLQTMQDRPHLAAVYCGHDLIINGQVMAPTFRPKDELACAADIARYCMPAHDPTGMYRVRMVKHMRYDESLFVAEGLDYILRVGEQWPMRVVGSCLYSYRVSTGTLSRSKIERRLTLVKDVLRRACERRGDDFQKRFYELIHHADRYRAVEADNNLAARFMESVCDLRKAGRRLHAIRTGLSCSALRRGDLHYHKALLFSIMPMWWVRRIRSVPV